MLQKNRYFGTREFYRHTLQIAIPIMVQDGISNFVSMLDNIMVGQVGTSQMSGVAIVNQLIFVYNLMIFGGLAGIGIFTAQFAGKGDQEGIRYTIRMKAMLAILLSILALLIFQFSGSQLIGLWLKGESGSGDMMLTMSSARNYLLAMYFGFLPFAATQVFASTLRENGETMVPMKAGLIAVLVNLTGNYILISGHFGAPALGVTGAAIATVISRFVEMAVVLLYLLRSADRFPFVHGMLASLHVPKNLFGKIAVKAFPLLLNETLWSLGQTALSQQYSMLGLNIVAAFNISNTICNVFNIAFISMGNAIAIILGQELGSGKTSEVRDDAAKLTVFSILLCCVSGLLLFLISGLFPEIYNTSGEIRQIAAGLIRISALCMPMYACENAQYFTLRSGGKTWITFLFDSCFVWVISIPAAHFLTHYTSLSILPLFALVQSAELIKCVIGGILVHRGAWIHDLTGYAG